MDWVEKPNEFQHPKPLKIEGSLKPIIVFENDHIVVINKPAGMPS